ncbi:MAG TPA: glycosyltransferase [Polyangiaceae bacterium]|jgi:glycosyltransferase involved in cell wall biosynthesis
MTRLTSIVVPALNEDLVGTLRRLDEGLEGLEGAFEVLFVDDSPDEHRASQRQAMLKTSSRSEVRFIDGPRRGKGAAIRLGVGQTKGERVFTMDADLPVPLEHIGEFLRLLDSGASMVMAERPLSRKFDTWQRFVVSRGLLAIQRAFVFHSSEFSDTQCGFKAFRGDLARDIARAQIVDGGMYDLEYVFEAHRRGSRIVRVPVVPNAEIRESRINIWRCFTGDWIDVVRIRAK